jgi:hypothetical protein
MEVPTLTVVCREGRSPVHDTFLHGGCCPAAGTFLISWPRSRTRGRSAGAGIRWPGCWPWGSRRWSRFGGSFAAIGQWCRRHRPGGAGRAGRGLRPGGGVRVRPGQPRCTRPRPRRWLHIRAVQAGGRLVIAIDGKTVRDSQRTLSCLRPPERPCPVPASPSYAVLAGEELDHGYGLRPNASDTATYIGA